MNPMEAPTRKITEKWIGSIPTEAAIGARIGAKSGVQFGIKFGEKIGAKFGVNTSAKFGAQFSTNLHANQPQIVAQINPKLQKLKNTKIVCT